MMITSARIAWTMVAPPRVTLHRTQSVSDRRPGASEFRNGIGREDGNVTAKPGAPECSERCNVQPPHRAGPDSDRLSPRRETGPAPEMRTRNRISAAAGRTGQRPLRMRRGRPRMTGMSWARKAGAGGHGRVAQPFGFRPHRSGRAAFPHLALPKGNPRHAVGTAQG